MVKYCCFWANEWESKQALVGKFSSGQHLTSSSVQDNILPYLPEICYPILASILFYMQDLCWSVTLYDSCTFNSQIKHCDLLVFVVLESLNFTLKWNIQSNQTQQPNKNSVKLFTQLHSQMTLQTKFKFSHTIHYTLLLIYTNYNLNLAFGFASAAIASSVLSN